MAKTNNKAPTDEIGKVLNLPVETKEEILKELLKELTLHQEAEYVIEDTIGDIREELKCRKEELDGLLGKKNPDPDLENKARRLKKKIRGLNKELSRLLNITEEGYEEIMDCFLKEQDWYTDNNTIMVNAVSRFLG